MTSPKIADIDIALDSQRSRGRVSGAPLTRALKISPWIVSSSLHISSVCPSTAYQSRRARTRTANVEGSLPDNGPVEPWAAQNSTMSLHGQITAGFSISSSCTHEPLHACQDMTNGGQGTGNRFSHSSHTHVKQAFLCHGIQVQLTLRGALSSPDTKSVKTSLDIVQLPLLYLVSPRLHDAMAMAFDELTAGPRTDTNKQTNKQANKQTRTNKRRDRLG